MSLEAKYVFHSLLNALLFQEESVSVFKTGTLTEIVDSLKLKEDGVFVDDGSGRKRGELRIVKTLATKLRN